MNDFNWKYYQLVQSIKFLSLPYEEQEKYLPDFTDKPFEVIDGFDNAFLLFPSIIENMELSKKAIADIIRLRIFIDSASSTPELEDIEEEQFKIHPEWNKIREFSKKVLQSMGEPWSEPDPKFI